MVQPMKRVPLTVYQKHKIDWGNCERCYLHETRQKVVFARGKIPCTILFVGEAPGDGEDSTGVPFIGPAGKIADDIIKRATLAPSVRVGFYNVIGCIPKHEDGTKTKDGLDPECVMECADRIQEFVTKVAKPEMIVTFGREPETWLDPKYHYTVAKWRERPSLALIHPAAILKMPVNHQMLAVQRCAIELRNFVDDYYEQKEFVLKHKDTPFFPSEQSMLGDSDSQFNDQFLGNDDDAIPF